jgi:hypothetical protein
MYRLVYVSSATEFFLDTQLENLLFRSRQNNATLGITGMLLYKDGNFMQCLEGPKDAVLKLKATIQSDPRHRGMIVLLKEENAEPQFNEWAMGFKKIDAKTASEVPGYSDFLDLPLTSKKFQSNPSKSLKLLLSFKRDMR